MQMFITAPFLTKNRDLPKYSWFAYNEILNSIEKEQTTTSCNKLDIRHKFVLSMSS